MSSPGRPKVSGVLLILLGLGIVAFVVVSMPHAGQQKYSHEVRPIADGQVPEASYLEVVDYEDLPPTGKGLFRAAMDSDDEYVVYGTDNVPEEWHYPTDTGPQPMYVQYEGTYYEFLRQGDSFEELSGYVAGFVALVGVTFAVAGGWRYLDRPVPLDGRVTSGVAVACIVSFLGVGVRFVTGIDVVFFVVGGLALGALVAATGVGAE